ncbi:MAG: NADH-quinone oxidoreductase subunit B family protein [Planctomycetota bacterium]|jgi:F420-non-reducing hydrogenase small subunit
MSKSKLAINWAASCGGCDMAILELQEKILDVAEAFDIVFWPAAMDIKHKDVEAMEDNSIDVCLFNGAIRSSENEHMAKLLRKKSKVLVAFGSCAHEGCIPGLANLNNKKEVFDYVYKETPSTDNPEDHRPQTEYKVDEGTLNIPSFYDTVKTLGQTVEVDYFIPGCPPVAEQIWNAVEAIISGQLPEKGSVVGAFSRTVCHECEHKKEEKKIKKFVRPHEIEADWEICLLEQGIICCGPATRSGCGAQCLKANMPCRGCYGPPPEVKDQGAKLLSAVASVIDADSEEEIEKIIDDIPDPIGTFYRFGLPHSTLRRKIIKDDKANYDRPDNKT